MPAARPVLPALRGPPRAAWRAAQPGSRPGPGRGSRAGLQDAARTPAGDWRHIVWFGRNVASYKFALGQVLLDLGARQQSFIRLEDLAVPYAAAICEHLQVEDRQSTSA